MFFYLFRVQSVELLLSPPELLQPALQHLVHAGHRVAVAVAAVAVAVAVCQTTTTTAAFVIILFFLYLIDLSGTLPSPPLISLPFAAGNYEPWLSSSPLPPLPFLYLPARALASPR